MLKQQIFILYRLLMQSFLLYGQASRAISTG